MSRPSVSVIVATRDRPQLLRRAVASILGQRYDGPIEVIAVFDQSEPDLDLVRSGTDRSVRVHHQHPTARPARRSQLGHRGERPGPHRLLRRRRPLAARQAGRPGGHARGRPALEVVTTGLLVEYRDRVVPRVLDRDRITFDRAGPRPRDGGPPVELPRLAIRRRGDRAGRRGHPRRLRRGLGLAPPGRSTGRRRRGPAAPREGLLARVLVLLGALADDRRRHRLPAGEVPGVARRPGRAGQRPRAQVDRPRRARPDRRRP